MDVSLKNVRKEFRGMVALDDVSLDIRSGELIALLGPSGSGKTTLLRLIAGLDYPSRGQILFGSEDASRKSVRERHVGFVFQHYALFRHMTVFENIAFGLRVRPRGERPSRAEIKNKVSELLSLIQLEGLEKRYPSQMSGGQCQRVALARAMAIDPTVLLLDEPFGALDAQVRKDLRRWLRDLHDKTQHTTVFVTHDQEEAMELADRVVVVNQGKIEQVGVPDDVYDEPATPFVYGFLGATNILPGRIADGQVFLEGFETSLVPANGNSDMTGPVNIFIRPHEMELTEDRQHCIPGVVQMTRHFSGITHLEVRIPSPPFVLTAEIPDVRLPGRKSISEGSRILLRPRRFGVFPRDGATDTAGRSGSGRLPPRLQVVS
jgi:sulfate transport system ATP-binding protein